ncbi:uncharacterized protein TRUGW13939_10951 [Talaromyces rugulosus]|uniref:HD domain-containing protein n=1 Tax=Talaromyces rugulosus TaxID=121627 RepID=A0A7H8RBG6_TALRU|nr:uncharacterized protein TRUGW13939_10951 [Talaromyces rugulosus]QKX63780.1 hypothetical protein TRUGW13939_10951 [Talaromyces rugulosus]
MEHDADYPLTASQIQFFEDRGYLLIRNFLSTSEAVHLQQWAQEVHDLPRTEDAPWMPYEEVNADGKKVLCRTENFANTHAGFNAFLRGSRTASVLEQLAGEKMLLFKEKINYKLAGSGGFDPHIDANAYTHVKNIKHLTILAAVDEMNSENGGLDVVEGSHREHVPLGSDRCIGPSWVESHTWVPCNLSPGDILLFGSYLAHRSGPNRSSKDRKAIYATYNSASEGELHDKYYQDRRELWPATHLRKEGVSYEEGRERYAYGSPMLTIGAGKQNINLSPNILDAAQRTNTYKKMDTPLAKAESIVAILEKYGQGDYLGESITQLEHCLQAAHQAQTSGGRDELVLAALLHDIGQIIPLEATKEVRMNLGRDSAENVGRVGHEAIGAQYLRSLGFSETVCRLVNSHVAAKRYLTAVNKTYYDSLSSASQKSLKFQGGPFIGEELDTFEHDPLRDEMISLRLWDDAAKVVGVEDTTPRAAAYQDLMVAHLTSQKN